MIAPTWSDSRPPFDKAADGNIRIHDRDSRIQIEVHVRPTRGHSTFYSGRVLIPISVSATGILATAPWRRTHFVLLFGALVLLAFSIMGWTELDLVEIGLRDFGPFMEIGICC